MLHLLPKWHEYIIVIFVMKILLFLTHLPYAHTFDGILHKFDFKKHGTPLSSFIDTSTTTYMVYSFYYGYLS